MSAHVFITSRQTERMDVLTATRAVGQRAIVLRASTENDFEIAFATLVREHAGALLVTGDALFNSRRDRLIALAARHAVRWRPRSCGKLKWRILPVGEVHYQPAAWQAATGGTRHG